ncbi:ABC transporter family protein (macronuclear) [Tetrahymena thermophila SB210]|uniref:ABC transporter family protein n=1 Tax=Tetrahymena thermophila (strain SB210) TaxID=312017 RepID=I7MEL7_TETTS|nr:ABC transporter family protein [Tetrahymena thermophila SB210]EAR97153.2 ABC transporter family protein [Tetrahymena thermophila SB210]|eukprot:XP_001017398.2 ABC transporter family protein [Tetrahymena thermophila SB210]
MKSKFSIHLKALMRKNYILWKRNWCCSIFEVFLPVLLVAFFYLIRAKIQIQDIPQYSYMTYDPGQTSENVYTELVPDYQQLTNPLTGQTFKPYIKDCLTGSNSDFPSFRNGHVAMIDSSGFLTDVANILQNDYGYQIKQYPDIDTLNDYITSQGYQNDVCMGIYMEQYTNNQYKYRLMFNSSDYDYIEIPISSLPSILDYYTEQLTQQFLPWRDSGFLQLQTWIDNIILRTASGDPTQKINPIITSMTVEQHRKDDLADTLKGNFSVFVVLPMILGYLRMTYGLLIEKEKKIREGMKIMGMSTASFYISWVLYYLIIFVLTSILVATILKTAIFKHSDWSVLFVWHFLFGISLLFQSLFITTFFTKARIGNIAAMLFFLFQYMIQFVLDSSSVPSESTRLSTSIFSHTGTTYSCDVFLLVEGQEKGISWDNLTLLVNNYRISTNLWMDAINILIFFVLSVYFDLVFPNDFGKKLHPLFFIQWIWKKKQTKEQQKKILLDKMNDEEEYINFDNNIEDVAKNLKDQEELNQVVSLKNIRKVYPSGKKAVNGLSFTMYNGQIFALLGHNGAGKTSTISMLTGMYEMTDGEAVALGKDVESQMEEIRTFMGVCPQYDILFDDLTVKEHLELFAVFKGMSDSKKIEEEVKKHIEDVDLQEKTNELSKNLSGGQRRRLSVAIAFIGGSKLIYLDEPTSGMDTSARRHIWDMLKRYKSDKVICLTTHFMDEADYLGDRIGIMADGQIVCLGRPLFLKNKFGTGYNLTLVKKNPTDSSQPIKEFVKQYIQDVKILSDVSAEVCFQLQNEQISSFPELFKNLDSQLDALNIQSYGISITTLEEVFLRVAHLKEEKKLLEKKKKEEEERIKNGNDKNKSDLGSQSQIAELEDSFDLNKVRVTKKFELFKIHMWAMFVKRAIYFKRDIRSLLCEVILPCLVIVFGLSLTLIKFIDESPAVSFSPSDFPNPLNEVVSKSPSVPDNIADSIYSSFASYQSYNFEKDYASITTPDAWDQQVFSEKTTTSVGAYFITQVSSNQVSYVSQVNSIYRDGAPFVINQMNVAAINYQLKQLNKPTISIQVISDPFLNTYEINNFEGSASGLVASFIYSIGLAFIPASIITFTVKERTDKIKHQQLVSGVSIFSYWLSNYLIDFVKHIVPAIFSYLMIYAYNIKGFNDSDSIGVLVMLLFLYGWSVIPFTYVSGFLFADYGNAQVAAFFINFFCGGIIPLIIAILRIIDSTRNAGIYVGWILRIIPSFSFGYGVLNIGNRSLYAFSDSGSKTVQSAYAWNIAGGDLLMMFLEGFLYFILVFIIEYASHISSFTQLMSHENSVPYVPKQYDDDVQKEIDEVEKSTPSDYVVRVNKLRKVFVPSKDRIKVAVDQVSFGISNGECFTLLGVNGAGKTTTFKILSGEINQTSGDCHINGFDVKTQLAQARNYIGYCPQFDALIENLTAREHLELYAAIKGIPKDLRDRLITQKIKELDLTEFEHKLAGTYSGGNKRKLSVAIAMLGNPPTVFLDEPSTGMDPAARRFMWSVISRISTKRKTSSVILTTHSMEEAEALSTRIAIQVEGILKCIGTVQQIKDKFGEGYEVEIKLNVPSDEQTIEYIQSFGVEKEHISSNIHMKDLGFFLEKMKATHLKAQIQPDKEGSQLYSRLNSTFGVSLVSLAQYIILENLGEQIKKYIKEQLGDFSVIEHFDDFYRFRIEASISIGKMFEAFEQNKSRLSIQNYSVKQATIEQIFNLFATNQIPLNYQKKQKNPKQEQLEQQHKPKQEIQMINIPDLNEQTPIKYLVNDESIPQSQGSDKSKIIQIRNIEHKNQNRQW